MADMSTIDQGQVQGVVFTGYPELPHAAYLIVEVIDRRRAGAWLRALTGVVTDGRKRQRQQAINVAFSHAGLAALGLNRDSLATFPREFGEGMAGSEARSRILGDTGPSAPRGWKWGARVPGQPTKVHVILMLYAQDKDGLDGLIQAQRAAFEGGLRELFVRDTFALPDQKEHFGFVDGISQPRIEGADTTRKPGLTFVKPGEFILGHRNEYDQLPSSPAVPGGPMANEHLPALAGGDGRRDLGAHGSYVVVRQLAQDVAGFWAAMREHSRAEGGVASEPQAVRLAAKCVGRWPSGAPLTLSPDEDRPSLGRENQFGYRANDDAAGLKCPVGAHVRRANPRDSLEPGPEESAKLVKRHMIMRRGRSYGPPLGPFQQEAEPRARGLFFIAVNANISRQFEFIQQTWLNNRKFDGLQDETDPISGAREPGKPNNFRIPEAPVRRRLVGLPNFVTTEGGEYFFLPGLRALRYLGELAGT
jgi:Dyp-type peroxidase family